MPNFAELQKSPAGKAVKPKALPVGNYSGVVKSYSIEKAPEGKNYTSMLRVQIALLDWPENATEEEKLQPQPDGSSTPINLASRQLRKDFYDNRVDLLDDFMRSLGIEMSGQSYEETWPQMIGCHVNAYVEQYLNQKTNELGNQIGALVGAK